MNSALQYAHRGYTKAHPENSLAAMREAVRLGFDGIECDVQVTQDGVPCIHHDDSINRMTNGSGLIREMNWQDLQKYQLNDSGETIPSLEELLEVCAPFQTVNLEIKAALDQCPAIMHSLDLWLSSHPGRLSQLMLSSFDFTVVRACRDALPNVQRGLLVDKGDTDFANNAKVCEADIILPHFESLDLAISICGEAADQFRWWTWPVAQQEDLAKLKQHPHLAGIIIDCLPL